MSIRLQPAEHRALREAYLESIKNVLAPAFRGSSGEQVAGAVRATMDSLSPVEQAAFARLSLQNTLENLHSEDFMQSLGQFGRSVSQALPGILRTVAPIAQVAAPLVGTLIGGPIGGMAGNMLGGLIGQAGGGPPPRPQSPRPAAQQPFAGFAAPAAMPQQPYQQPIQQQYPPQQNALAAGAGSNPAAAQLMALLANPQLLQAILGQVMGQAGQGAASVQTPAGPPAQIPFAALMNSVSELAQRAAEESVQGGGDESEGYILNPDGSYTVADPSNAGQRADRVAQLLNGQPIAQRQPSESSPFGRESQHDDLTEWLVSAGMVR